MRKLIIILYFWIQFHTCVHRCRIQTAYMNKISLFLAIEYLVLFEIISREIMFCVIFLVFVSRYLILLFWHRPLKGQKPYKWLEFVWHQNKIYYYCQQFCEPWVNLDKKKLKAHHATISWTETTVWDFIYIVSFCMYICMCMCAS